MDAGNAHKRSNLNEKQPMTDYASEHWEDLYDIVDPATLRDIQAAFAEYLAGTLDWSHYLNPVPLRDRCTDRDDWFEQGMLVVLRSSSHSDEVVKVFIGELIKQSNR